jgi:hypothetical protein
MNKEQMMVELGSIGEDLVADLYRRQGSEVVLSEDKYDSVKDMLIDGKTCEVKTQMPYHIKKMFSIRVDQYFKCMNANKLIWVEAPSKHNDYRIDIYESPVRGMRFFRKYKPKGLGYDMYGMDFCETTLIDSLEGSIEAIRMMKLTNSDMSVVNKLHVN